ncbi:TonB-dependent receptor [Moritella sp.]|uniref:TonB-dependent receptor domain-containing protein n=1 Tax=Moritella sp. TaxID=78556 RepID=UPI001D3EF9D1|nr:TonB-dependent receptor [Moritella sp.]MCJ8348135.1 TonB-dependent receptor [Moritella sp.]NQZ42334.1 TonB-dependent receptor [Moritella sp.]
MDKNKSKLILCISAALCTSSVFSQALASTAVSTADESAGIGHTLVTDTLDIDHVQGTKIITIDKAELDATSHRHAAEMLQDATSVYTPMSYANPMLSVNMRGVQDFGRVNTNIDGMRQNFQRSGYQDQNGSLMVDPELLQSIKINKGLSSGAGGLGTIGGQVSFRTVDFDDVIKDGDDGGIIIRGETGVGKWSNGNKVKSSLTAGYNITDNVAVMGAITKTKTDDYRMGKKGKSIIGPGRADRSSGRRTPTKFAVPEHLLDTYKTGYSIESVLGKIRWNITEQQSLKFSYIKTKSEFNAVDYAAYSGTYQQYWLFKTNNKIANENISLDYSFKSDSPWLNLNAKVYRANTQLDEYFPKSPDISQGAQGYCQMFPTKFYFSTGKRCSAQTSTYETDTYGLVVNNQSFIDFGDTLFSANYGFEAALDTTKPREINGPDGAASGIASTPDGRRALTSIYLDSRLDYQEWLSLFAGVRYDRYNLQGDARVNTKLGDINPAGIDETFTVDNTDTGISPTFGLSLRPFDFMEITSNYGKGWRPPSLTETLIAGGTPNVGAFVSALIPSPELKAETSTNLDLGLKFNFNQVLTQDDSLTLALSHYRTKIDDYMIMHLGVITNDNKGTTTQAFVNRTEPVKIKGSELAINYDAGFIYGGVSGSVVDVDEGSQCYNPHVLPDAVGTIPQSPCGRTFYSPFPSQDKLTAYLGTRLLHRTLDARVTMRRLSDRKGLLDIKPLKEERLLDESSGIGYTRWDLTLKYTPVESLAISLYGRNLTDQQYSSALGAYRGVIQAPGRSVAVGVQYQF